MIDVKSLPAVPIAERRNLPEASGVYFAISSEDNILYIGKATNLRNRWMHHQHCSLFEYLGSVKIAYFETDFFECRKLEKDCIAEFKPELNSHHKPKLPKIIQTDQSDNDSTPSLSIEEAIAILEADEHFHAIRQLIADGELVTIARAAEHVGIHRVTLYEHITNGHVQPVFTIDDGTNVFYKPDLDQFAKEKKPRGRPRLKKEESKSKKKSD